MQLCIVCKNKSTKQIFDCCNIVLHTRCVSQYLKKSSFKKCPTCNKKKKCYNTRFFNKENIFIQKIKFFLNKLNTPSIVSARKLMILEMFDYISKNMWFLSKHEKFKQTVEKKLIQFYKVDEWVEANNIYYKLFKKCIKL